MSLSHTPYLFTLTCLAFLVASQDLSWVAVAGGNAISFETQQYSECLAVAERAACHPFANHPACVSTICNQCTAFSKLFASCCRENNPGACIDSGAAANANTATALEAPTSLDPNEVACATAAAYVSACESLTPPFTNLPYTQQKTCLCNDASGNFVPAPFDNAVSSCYNYLKTADPSDAPAFSSGLLGFCTATAAAPSTAHASTTVGSIVTSSIASTPNGGTTPTSNAKSSSTPVVASSPSTSTSVATPGVSTTGPSSVASTSHASTTAAAATTSGQNRFSYTSPGLAFTMTILLLLVGILYAM